MFGKVMKKFLKREDTILPRVPMVAKVYLTLITINYRESYKMFASNGIVFNHETH